MDSTKIKFNFKCQLPKAKSPGGVQTLALPSSLGLQAWFAFLRSSLQPPQAPAPVSENRCCPEALLTPQGGDQRPLPASVSLQWEQAWGQGQSRTPGMLLLPRALTPAEALCQSHCDGLTIAQGRFLTSRPQWVALESAAVWLHRTAPHLGSVEGMLRGTPAEGKDKSLLAFIGILPIALEMLH